MTEKTMNLIKEIQKDIDFLETDKHEKMLSLLCKSCRKIVQDFKELMNDD
ncbi:MAG: hypothetical protein GPJ50_15595 [Candidatus Heimdallarchaeota archaeon]|nr:hypothetical protein [Candidatus Heimdallarchaeota archaeon]